MTRSGQDARTPPPAMPPAGSGPAQRPRTARRDRRVAWQVIGLVLLARMLRSRRSYHAVAVGVIGLVAVARIGWENRATAFARLAAWDKRQAQRLERKAKQQGRAVKGGVRVIRSRATRGLADRHET